MRSILPFFLLIFSSTVWAEENFGTKVGETNEYNVYVDTTRIGMQEVKSTSNKKAKIHIVQTTLEMKPQDEREKIGDSHNATASGYDTYRQLLDCSKKRFITIADEQWLSSILTIPEDIKVGSENIYGHKFIMIYSKPNFLRNGTLIDEKTSNAIFDKVCR